MVTGFDFEIYENGDYDRVCPRDGKGPRALRDNGKGDSPMVVMIEDDKADDYIIPRYNETGGRDIDGRSGLDLMLSARGREPGSWVVVISRVDNRDKRRETVSPDFFPRDIRGDIYPQGSPRSSVSYYVDKPGEDGRLDELREKIRVRRDRIYDMGIISLSDDEATV